jgi:hypothetical protein
MQNEDDKIIAEGLLQIRAGILSGDIQQIADGYKHISGETLSPPVKQKSRLESIREMMDIKEQPAKKRGRKPKAKKTEEDLVDRPIEEKTLDSGLVVISTEFSEEEAEENARLAKKKPRLPSVKRNTRVSDNSKDEDADTRFYDKPTPPPWRS